MVTSTSSNNNNNNNNNNNDDGGGGDDEVSLALRFALNLLSRDLKKKTYIWLMMTLKVFSKIVKEFFWIKITQNQKQKKKMG